MWLVIFTFFKYRLIAKLRDACPKFPITLASACLNKETETELVDMFGMKGTAVAVRGNLERSNLRYQVINVGRERATYRIRYVIEYIL